MNSIKYKLISFNQEQLVVQRAKAIVTAIRLLEKDLNKYLLGSTSYSNNNIFIFNGYKSLIITFSVLLP